MKSDIRLDMCCLIDTNCFSFYFRPNVCAKTETRSFTKLVPCIKSYDHLVKVWSHNCTNGRRICHIYEPRFNRILWLKLISPFLFLIIRRIEYYRSEQTITTETNVTTYHCCLGWTRLVHDYGCPIGKNQYLFFLQFEIIA